MVEPGRGVGGGGGTHTPPPDTPASRRLGGPHTARCSRGPAGMPPFALPGPGASPALPRCGAARAGGGRGRAGDPRRCPGEGGRLVGGGGEGGGKRSGGGASPGRCAGARRCTASPRRSRCNPRCGRAPAGLPLPCAREKLPSPWGARAGPVQLVGGVVGGLGLGTGTGEGRGLQAGRQGRAGGTRLRLSVRGACVCTDRACVRRRLPVPARICMCRCACTCVLGVHVCLCLGACLCLCIGVYPGICVFGCGCVGVSPCGGVWM